MKTDEEVIDGAIELIQQGWCRGNFHKSYVAVETDADGAQVFGVRKHEFCLAGALQESAMPGSFTLQKEDFLPSAAGQYNKLINALVGQLNRGVADFNDQYAESKEDVLLELKKLRESLGRSEAPTA